MSDINIKPDIVFNLSQLKFVVDNSGKNVFSFSIATGGDKLKIESLPTGLLPDKMVIDIDKINGKVEKLIDILRKHLVKFDFSSYTEIGNDIDYAIKELPKFKSRLKMVVDDAAAKMTADMFGNTYAGFKEYTYIEILFSQNYKKILSIRLLGRPPSKTNAGINAAVQMQQTFNNIITGGQQEQNIPQQTIEPRRFVIFNIPNEHLDLNIVNLIYNADKIIAEDRGQTQQQIREARLPILSLYGTPSISTPPQANENSFEFVTKNFIPPPPIHDKPEQLPGPLGTGLGVMENLLKNYSPKTYDIFLADNDKFSALSTREQVVNFSQRMQLLGSFQNSALGSALGNLDYVKAMKEGLPPYLCLLLLWNFVFGKLEICGTIQQILKMLIKIAMPDPAVLVKDANVIVLFDSIDSLPGVIRDIIYINFDNESLNLNLTSALVAVQEYVSSLPQPERLLRCTDYNTIFDLAKGPGGLSYMFRELKSDYPDYYGDIEKIFNDNFSRDALIFIVRSIADLLMAIDYCNFPNITLQLPTFKIPDLWFDFSFNIKDLIFGLICELLSALLDLLIDMLLNLNRLDQFFEQFINDENNVDLWQKYVDYALYLLISTDRAQTKLQSISANSSTNALSTTEGVSVLRNLNSSTLRPPGLPSSAPGETAPLTAADYCADTQRASRSRIFSNDNDIDLEVPSETQQIIDDFVEAQATLQERKAARDVLDKLRYFTYCKSQDFFSTDNIVDPSAIDSLRQISETVPPLYTTEATEINTTQLYNKNNLANSLKEMFRQIKTVLSSRELSDLLSGKYSEEVAAVVRVITKVNFPHLTEKVDPVKYFTMLGKVIGRTTKELENFKVFGE